MTDEMKDGLYLPDVRQSDHGGEMCGASFTYHEIEYAPPSNNYNAVFCEMAKGHAGAHIDASMAGRIAWMTPAEVEVADAGGDEQVRWGYSNYRTADEVREIAERHGIAVTGTFGPVWTLTPMSEELVVEALLMLAGIPEDKGGA